jgi:hypothetical protein
MTYPYWFGAFCRWLAAGKTYPRPPQVPARIPKTLWPAILLRVALIRARIKPDRLLFWRSRGAWEAWGLTNGQFTPSQLASWAKLHGFKWVAVLDTRELREKVKPADLRIAFERDGIKLVIWSWATTLPDAKASLAYWEPDAYVVNVEHRGPWYAFCQGLRAHVGASYPLAVITNFAGAGAMPDGTYSKQEASAFWSENFACITECYMVNEQGAQPSLSPSGMDWTARTQLGYPETFPCFGIYRTTSKYYWPYLLDWPYHSWYLAENWYPE